MEDTTIEAPLKTFQDQYLQRDFPNAILTLEKNKSDISEGIWHFNMGTVQGEMQNWPMARYHYLMAEESGLVTKELQQNLKLIEDRLDIQKSEKPIDTTDYLVSGSLGLSKGILTSLSLVILVFAIWLLKKKPNYKNAAVMIVFVLAPLITDFWIKSWTKSIVTAPVPLYEAPSSIFGVRGEIPIGVLLVTQEKEGWEKIIFPSRFAGWIKPTGLKRLK